MRDSVRDQVNLAPALQKSHYGAFHAIFREHPIYETFVDLQLIEQCRYIRIAEQIEVILLDKELRIASEVKRDRPVGHYRSFCHDCGGWFFLSDGADDTVRRPNAELIRILRMRAGG